MKLTRDGSIWMVLLIGGLAGFLAGHFDLLTKAFPSLGLVWQARLELVFALAGFIGGYLRMSPAALSPEHPLATNEASVVLSPVNSSKVITILLACVLAGSAWSCAPKQYHTAVIANSSVAEAIFALQDAETAAHNAGLVDGAHHALYKAQILRLLEAGDDLTVALQHWDPKMPPPANVAVALADVSKLLADVQVVSPRAADLIAKAGYVLKLLQRFGVLSADRNGTDERYLARVLEMIQNASMEAAHG